jgi:aminoglycoside N3'-acetyltransferase
MTEFTDTLNVIKGETKSKLETELGKKIYRDKKSLAQIDAYVKNVRELQELGVINNSPRLQDMAKLVDDVSKTFDNAETCCT